MTDDGGVHVLVGAFFVLDEEGWAAAFAVIELGYFGDDEILGYNEFLEIYHAGVERGLDSIAVAVDIGQAPVVMS